MENKKRFDLSTFWLADWAFPIIVGMMASAVFAGTML